MCVDRRVLPTACARARVVGVCVCVCVRLRVRSRPPRLHVFLVSPRLQIVSFSIGHMHGKCLGKALKLVLCLHFIPIGTPHLQRSLAAASKAIDDGCDPRFVLMMGRWRSWHVLGAFYNRAGCRVVPKSTRQASQ